MAGTLRVGGKVLATHDSGTDEISLASDTNTSNMSFDANHAGIKTALNASGDAPIYACRAWVNFVGSSVTNPASTAGINAQGNVVSLFDNGTGDYTINFADDMSTADLVVSACTLMASRAPRPCTVRDTSVSHLRIGIFDGSSLTDTTDEVMIAVFC
jgi:hypothetical protein